MPRRANHCQRLNQEYLAAYKQAEPMMCFHYQAQPDDTRPIMEIVNDALKDLIFHLRNEYQAEAINQAMQFKKSMEEIQAMAGTSEQELEKIAQHLRDMGSDHAS